MQNQDQLDPRELVWMVVGLLYSHGHYHVRLTQASMDRAIIAACHLIRAVGLVPVNDPNPTPPEGGR